MASNPTNDEAERARRDGEAFGRQIGERAMIEVGRVALTLADVNTHQAQLKSVGLREALSMWVQWASARMGSVERLRQHGPTEPQRVSRPP